MKQRFLSASQCFLHPVHPTRRSLGEVTEYRLLSVTLYTALSLSTIFSAAPEVRLLSPLCGKRKWKHPLVLWPAVAGNSMYTKTCLQIASSPRFTKASFLGSHGNSSSAVSGLTGSPIFPNMPKVISFGGGGAMISERMATTVLHCLFCSSSRPQLGV